MIIIFNQTKCCAYNWDNTLSIYAYNNHITIEDMISNCSTLANYSSEELAHEALEMVVSAIASGFPVIYMPYEDKVQEHLNNKQIATQNRGGRNIPSRGRVEDRKGEKNEAFQRQCNRRDVYFNSR